MLRLFSQGNMQQHVMLVKPRTNLQALIYETLGSCLCDDYTSRLWADLQIADAIGNLRWIPSIGYQADDAEVFPLPEKCHTCLVMYVFHKRIMLVFYKLTQLS